MLFFLLFAAATEWRDDIWNSLRQSDLIGIPVRMVILNLLWKKWRMQRGHLREDTAGPIPSKRGQSESAGSWMRTGIFYNAAWSEGLSDDCI